MIKAENLFYLYDKNSSPVLKDINLDIQQGEYTAVIGPNGCGKSTLVKHFNGLLFPANGSVQVDGINTTDSSSIHQVRQKVGMIFQNPDNQVVAMTVEEDVAFGPGNLKLPPGEIQKRIYEAMETAGISKYAQHPPHNLSGGEKQLLALAGILAMHPSYIILDEPTSSLAPDERQKVARLLQQLHKKGITIIHITHNMDEIVHADRIIVMESGKIFLEGPPGEVFSRVDELKKIGIGPPKITELMWQLKKAGIDVSTSILTVEDACKEIASKVNTHV
ncbi:MAG: energy-coupling factor transporter ATPase [Clostridiales bacterium]|nr:energy-coupling factor transporter ATPase [Clostridiales bacterium]MCF8023102.1 energy-coupling factor transporter ATPase [Clostridiales bacterium]